MQMQIRSWVITVVASVSLVFTAATNPEQFPNVATVAMPVLGLALSESKSKKQE